VNRSAGLALSGSIIALAALTGCASGGGAATSSEAEPSASASPSETTAEAVDAMVADSDLGEIIVDGEGMSVYMFDKDTKDADVSACTGDCLVAWPPVLTASEEPVVEGIDGTVGTIETPEGDYQLTVDGWPLYYYQKDVAPGDVTGQAVGDVWWVVAPSGEKIATPAG